MFSNPSRRCRPTPTPCSRPPKRWKGKCRRERPARAGTTTTHVGAEASPAQQSSATQVCSKSPSPCHPERSRGTLCSPLKHKNAAGSVAWECKTGNCNFRQTNSSPSWHRSLQLSCPLLFKPRQNSAIFVLIALHRKAALLVTIGPGQTDIVFL